MRKVLVSLLSLLVLSQAAQAVVLKQQKVYIENSSNGQYVCYNIADRSVVIGTTKAPSCIWTNSVIIDEDNPNFPTFDVFYVEDGKDIYSMSTADEGKLFRGVYLAKYNDLDYKQNWYPKNIGVPDENIHTFTNGTGLVLFLSQDGRYSVGAATYVLLQNEGLLDQAFFRLIKA